MFQSSSLSLSAVKLITFGILCVALSKLAVMQAQPPMASIPAPQPISFDRELSQYNVVDDALAARILSGSSINRMNDIGDDEGGKEEETGGAGGPDKEVLFDIKPYRDFARFDPRSPTSFFEFNTLFNASLARLDNGIFLKGKKGLQISTTFNRWLPPTTPGGDAALSNFELCIETKTPISVKSDEKLTVRARFTAHSLNILPHPYPDELVLNPHDDIRLGASHFLLADKTETGIVFHLFATETGIWGGYFRILFAPVRQEQGYRAFEQVRRLGDRPGLHGKLKGRDSSNGNKHHFTLSSYPHAEHGDSDIEYAADVQLRNYFGVGDDRADGHADDGSDWIDATIEYDRKHGIVRYYLGEQLVWTIDRIGRMKQSDDEGRNHLLASAPGVESIVSPKKFFFFPACNSHQVDLADPNKAVALRDNVALSRAVGGFGYYGPEMQFWDDAGARNSSFYGQGQVMTLDWFRVTRRKSEN